MVPHVCHSSTSVSEAQHGAAKQGPELLRCCWAAISRMMTWHGWTVPCITRHPDTRGWSPPAMVTLKGAL